jgi:site-specific DNA recombinase
VVVEDEAERVRIIFQRYLELGSLNLLMADLRDRRIVTKVRSLSSGRTIGGIPFTRGPLAHLLRNRFYIGEVAYRDEVFPGAQPPFWIETCSPQFRPSSMTRSTITRPRAPNPRLC